MMRKFVDRESEVLLPYTAYRVLSGGFSEPFTPE